MKAPRGIGIHLLKKNKIRRKALHRVSTGSNAFADAISTFRTRLCSAVHEKRKLRRVRAKAQILRYDSVDFPGLYAVVCTVAGNLQSNIIIYSRIAEYDIAYVHKNSDKNKRDQ